MEFIFGGPSSSFGIWRFRPNYQGEKSYIPRFVDSRKQGQFAPRENLGEAQISYFDL